MTVVYHRRVQEKLDDILNGSFLYATGHKHIFCSSWSRGISENSRKEICIACSKSMFKIFSEYQKRDIKRARYFQQDRESVNEKTFDQSEPTSFPGLFPLKNRKKPKGIQLQSEHDTRIWYHGTETVALKACLQAPPLLPPPQSTARLASLAFIFPI